MKFKSLPADDCGKLFWRLTWRLKLLWSVSEAFDGLRKSVCWGKALRGMWSLLMINLKVGIEIWDSPDETHSRVTLWIKFKARFNKQMFQWVFFWSFCLSFSPLVLMVALKTRKQWRTERGSARDGYKKKCVFFSMWVKSIVFFFYIYIGLYINFPKHINLHRCSVFFLLNRNFCPFSVCLERRCNFWLLMEALV